MKKVGKCGSGKNGQNKVGGKCIFAVNQFSWDKKLRSCILSNCESEKPPQFNPNQSVHAKKFNLIQISVKSREHIVLNKNSSWTAPPAFLEPLKESETD